MQLVNEQLPALYGGVSQQSPTMRLTSQSEAEVNYYGTVVDGGNKRPPSEHLVQLPGEDLSSALVHTVNRTAGERYTVVLTPGRIRVFEEDGTERTVTILEEDDYLSIGGRSVKPWKAKELSVGKGGEYRLPSVENGFAYRIDHYTSLYAEPVEPAWPTTEGATIDTGYRVYTAVPIEKALVNPKTDFVCVTVADYTFVVNRNVVVGMEPLGADVTADNPDRYWLNRMETGDSWEYRKDYTGYAAQARRDQYAPNPSGTRTYKGVRQSIQDLPETPQEGDLYRIQGTPESAFQSYYVVRRGGAWEETYAPNIKNKIDANTMPHALVRLPDGNFEFGCFSFAPRRVGDETTNPNPSFVGRTIRDVFFYQNRLGFCVGENVVLSRAGDFGNFYRLTVLDLLDDEVVDIGASETKITNLNHAVPFDTGMMVFSDQTQFRITHEGPLTPTSGSLDVSTSYTMKTDVRPFALGSDVYFVAENDNWARVLEYFVREDAVGTGAGDITGHVPRYIPAGVTKIFGSADHDVLFVLTDGAPNRLYVYKFHWTSETEKAQSAWNYWEFDESARILSGDVLGNYVQLLIQRPGGVCLERISLESGAHPMYLEDQIFLDRRIEVKGVYQTLVDKTEFTLPYPINQATARAVRGKDFDDPGAMFDPEQYEFTSPTTFRVPGNQTDGPVIIGENYVMRYTFSEQFFRNRQGTPVTNGRLILNTFTIYYKDTAYFRTEVWPYGQLMDPEVEEVIPAGLSEYTGKTLGSASLILGSPQYHTGSYSFSVNGDSTTAVVSLVNDTPYRSRFMQAEWEAKYHNRSRPLG